MEAFKILNSEFYAQTVERGKLVMKIYDVAYQGPLTKISTAVWTIDIREKVVGLDALEDRAQGLVANLPYFLIVAFFVFYKGM